MDLSVPFTRAQALAAGITDDALSGPRFRRFHHGVYVASSVEVTPQLRALAALVRFPPGAFASHLTAARLYGAPVPPDGTEHVTVLERDHRRRVRGITCHVAAPAFMGEWSGVRASLPLPLFLELAGSVPLVDAVVAGDWLVAARLLTLEDLSGIDPSAREREAATLVRAGAESPMETRTRLLLVLGGLPEPELNPRELDAYGRRRGAMTSCFGTRARSSSTTGGSTPRTAPSGTMTSGGGRPWTRPAGG